MATLIGSSVRHGVHRLVFPQMICRLGQRANSSKGVDMPVPPPLPKKSGKPATPSAPPAGKKAAFAGDLNTAESLKVDSPLDDVQRRVQQIANMPKEEFEAKYKEFAARERKESLAAVRDDVFQMSVSDKAAQKPLRVFFKKVTVKDVGEGWWVVQLDGKTVKALESMDTLYLPTEEMALAVANEWAQQKGHVNKLLMPMMDIASGSQLVDEFGIEARLEHLITFLRSDNLFYRHAQLREQEKKLCEPVCQWFDNFFGVITPRMEGLQSAKVAESTQKKVHTALLELKLNKYQIVSLYVVAQYTASIVLATALMFGGVSIENALAINRLEEFHNVTAKMQIDGYHDIRDADVTVKIAASHACWDMAKGLSVERTTVPTHLLKKKLDL